MSDRKRRTSQSVMVHSLRMIQTITTITIMVPTSPKPSISFLLLWQSQKAQFRRRGCLPVEIEGQVLSSYEFLTLTLSLGRKEMFS
jgi:hypothetical protein